MVSRQDTYPLTTPERVQATPGFPTGVASAVLDQLIAKASSDFRSQTGQWISRVENDTVTLDGDGSWCLLLPELPVTAVHFVTILGCGNQPGELLSPECCRFDWSAKGILRKCSHWPDRYRGVEVVYDHGYDPIPDDIQYAVAEAAAGAVSARPGVERVQLGQASYTFAKQGTTQTWANAVSKYKVRVK